VNIYVNVEIEVHSRIDMRINFIRLTYEDKLNIKLNISLKIEIMRQSRG
jgi:hypothetical protein